MKMKKFGCAVLCTAMLTAVFAPSAGAWSVFDKDYGAEGLEQSSTLVSDDMVTVREKDDPNDVTSLIYTVLPDGNAMITDYSGKFMEGYEFEFDIPSEIDGHTVVAIGDGALCDSAAKIVGITLPSTVKEIGNRAIYGRYLKYLKLNDGLEVIKDYAINCGDELETLVIPESVKYIGNEAVSGKALKNITLPNNLEYLGKNVILGTAYEAYPSNRENEILYLGQYLIAGLKIGYEELENPDPSAPTQTKQIHEWEAVGDIEIREGTTMMCADAFGMSNITSVKLPSTLKAIPYLGFYRCKNLDNVVIPGNVKDIGPNAFSWNESLTNLTIEEGVERIGEMAFFRCNNLNEVTIPKSVTQIDLQAFGWDYVNDYDVRNENLVINCCSGTAGEQYAKDNGFKYNLLDTGETVDKGEPTAAADSRHTCEAKGDNCAVKKFKDIMSAEGDTNHDGIEYCLDHGIMNGTGADTFDPESTITRAQFATMFYRLAGQPESSADGKFTDLTEDWYVKAVNWASANGIINGTGENTFSPYDTITREQIAAILYRYAETRGLNMLYGDGFDFANSFYSDKDDISDYARVPMEWCFANYVMFDYVDEAHGHEILIGAKIAPTRADTALIFSKMGTLLEYEATK